MTLETIMSTIMSAIPGFQDMIASVFENPFFFPALTLGAFFLGVRIHEAVGKRPAFQPVLVAIVLLSTFLLACGIPYREYRAATDPLVLLLIPAIIALAAPFYENFKALLGYMPVIIGTVVIAGSLIIAVPVVLVLLFGLGVDHAAAMTTKSVTAPIAVVVGEGLGAPVSLIVIGVFSTSLTGIAVIPAMLRYLDIREEAIQGLVLGITAHGFGVACALAYGKRATAFATMGMILMGIYVALAAPIVLEILGAT